MPESGEILCSSLGYNLNSGDALDTSIGLVCLRVKVHFFTITYNYLYTFFVGIIR